MRNKIFAMMAASVILFASCSKEGPTGPAGRDGNANVIGPNAVTVNSGDWTANSFGWQVVLTDADITSAVVSNGLVEVYIQYPNGSWSNLPDINGVSSFVDNFLVGKVTIYYQNSDGSVPDNPGTQVFRLVIVPSNMRLAHPNTNWKNYNEAMAVLNNSGAKVVSGAGAKIK